MAITTQSSTEYANQVADPVVKQPPSVLNGRVRHSKFSFTQSGIGDAGSIAQLVELPAGLMEIVRIYIAWTALGASRTLDLGHLAFVDQNGDTVAADPDAFSNGEDVSSAGNLDLVVGSTLESEAGWVLTAQINDGTIPDADTLDGYILTVSD